MLFRVAHPRFILLLLPLWIVSAVFGQTPTNQDCLAAIPICQNVYSTQQSYSGTGNYPNEINSNISCLGTGELNSVWYTFTVQQSGNLNFTITPNNSADDYDWAVYNLTNSTCAQIFTNPALQVSCNYSATPGNTGPTGASAQTSQGAAGTPFNAQIPVQQGQTYVINISNFSSTQFGYTINFGASSAVIFDQIPPQILTVNNPVCGANQLTLTFSENILCNTVQAADFAFTGPGGPYTVTAVTSPVCAAGGQYTNQYTITISPAITSAGTFTANLVGPVTDLCGNVAIFPAQLPFNVGSFTFATSSTPASCAANAGTATVAVTGAGPFTYVWQPNVSTSATASNLAGGIYTVTITDQSTGCSSTDTIHVNANTTFASAISASDTICPGSSTTLSVTPAGGTAPYTYNWSNALPNSNTVSATPATTTTYTVNVVDVNGCTSGPFTVTITVANAVTLTSSGNTVVCSGNSVGIGASAAGGLGQINYLWQPGNISGSSITVSPTTTTTYTITASDQCSQSVSQTVNVLVFDNPEVTFTANVFEGCAPLPVQFWVDTTGLSGASYLWSFGQNGQTSTSIFPNLTYTVAGCQDVSLTITNAAGCSTTETIPCMINVWAQPVAAFTPSTTFTNIDNSTISFDNNSTGGNTWLWDFGNTTTSMQWEPVITYETPGVYNVTLIVTNSLGCSDTASEVITVNDYHTLYVPNAFTPNGSGLNDIFIPVYANILTQDYELVIFNRWGQVVFESNTPDQGWDGSFRNNGTPCPLDVYVYTIRYTDNMYVKYQRTGHVSLIR
jgi:gliding motility-associated-like protein